MSNSELAAAAWNAVRRSDDAAWEKLSLLMKSKLTALAEKYKGNVSVDEGDYPPEGFAEKVAELASRQEFFAMGDGDGSGPELISMGAGEVQTAEHEDTHIPSPTPEDFDPLGRGSDECPVCFKQDAPGHLFLENLCPGDGLSVNRREATIKADNFVRSALAKDVDPLKEEDAQASGLESALNGRTLVGVTSEEEFREGSPESKK